MEFLLFLLIALLILGIFLYNRLKILAEAVKSRRANILAVTRKRADLAARLADIASSYGDHEKLTQLHISEDMTSMSGLMSANVKADKMINQVSSLAMAFPDLKANQTFQQLMSQLETIETEVLQRREAYNTTVEAYNGYRVRIPQVLVANACNFEEAPYFEVNAQGLDVLASFNTGDTKSIEALLKRSGERAQQVASQTRQAIRGSTSALPEAPPAEALPPSASTPTPHANQP